MAGGGPASGAPLTTFPVNPYTRRDGKVVRGYTRQQWKTLPCQSTHNVGTRTITCERRMNEAHRYHRAQLDHLAYVEWVDPAYWADLQKLGQKHLYNG